LELVVGLAVVYTFILNRLESEDVDVGLGAPDLYPELPAGTLFVLLIVRVADPYDLVGVVLAVQFEFYQIFIRLLI